MAKTVFSAFLRRFALVVATGITALAAFNYGVDPWWIYHDWSITSSRPRAENHEHEFKPYHLRTRQPETVLLGSSRVLIGLDPQHAAFAGQTVYNLGVSGASMAEVRALFEAAVATGKVRRAVLLLDFFAFNSAFGNASTFRPERLRASAGSGWWIPIWEDWKSLLSLAMARDSLTTLLPVLQPPVYDYRADGFAASRGVRPVYGQRWAFQVNLRSFAQNIWLPGGRYCLEPTGGPETPFAHLRAILDTARREGIELRLGTSPVHAWFLAALRPLGLEDSYHAWKIAVADTVAQSPFPLWDFAGFSDFATEAVPAEGDTSTAMAHYIDPSHFSPRLGDRMLDVLYGGAGFVGRLTPETAREMPTVFRAGRDRWIAAHPGDLSAITAITAAPAATARICPVAIVP